MNYADNPVARILYPKFQSLIDKLREWATGNEYVYDIETYPNFFSVAVVHVKTLQCYWFEMSPWYNNMKELEQFIYYLHVNRCTMVGFNNLHFDWPVTDFAFHMIPGGVSCIDIYNKVMAIFNCPHEERFQHVIWDDKQYVGQIDLFKINHYDNGAKSTSLKMLENNMGMENIEELPVEPGTYVQLHDRNNMYNYNWHDDAATLLFLSHNIKQIDLRKKLGEMYDHNFTNASESKIGSDIIKLALKKAGIPVNKKTPRDIIHFKECVFSYVNFERPEFKAVYDWIMKTSITKTKEVLNDIEVDWSLVKYMNPDCVNVIGVKDELLKAVRELYKERNNRALPYGSKIKLSMIPPGWSVENYTFIADRLHVVVDDFQFDFGTGGIHGSIDGATVKSNSRIKIKDVDVTSYYPNIGSKNRKYPAHLGEEFCDSIDGISAIRENYPKKAHPMENKAFKYALNCPFGLSNSVHSFLYDPKYTMTVTLNGQLLLCMLAEQLLKVPGLRLIQINTDGVTFATLAEYEDHCRRLYKWWEEITNLNLEEADYTAMYIRDVNNYIAIPVDGDPKHKGAYEYDLAETGQWHKNFNALIVPMAVSEFLLNGIDPKTYLLEKLKDPENRKLFCLRTKINRKDRLVLRDGYVEMDCQRVTRYYVVNEGGQLVKIMDPTPNTVRLYEEGDHYQHEITGTYEVKPPGGKPTSGRYKPVPVELRRKAPNRESQFESGYQIDICNKLDDFNADNLNINYYMKKILKLIEPVQ